MPYRKPADLPTTGNDCPRCRNPLVSEAIGDNSVERCTECLGVWVAAGNFNELLMDLDRQEAVRAREPGERSASKDGAKELACPCCDRVMGRYNFGRYSGVIVDSCRKHGIWLDRGELRRIVDFLAARGADSSDAPILRTKGAAEGEFTVVAGGGLLDGIVDLFLRTLSARRNMRTGTLVSERSIRR